MSCIPGVATPTEGFASLRAGANALKVFPAEAISPLVLKAWRAVFAQDIPLLPTGGVTEDSMASWRQAGATGFGIGGNLYRPGRTASEVRDSARSFVAALRATSSSGER
jgi:2-dehydro-3-deoxyphosphogalactonate aldolase